MYLIRAYLRDDKLSNNSGKQECKEIEYKPLESEEIKSSFLPAKDKTLYAGYVRLFRDRREAGK